MPTKKILWPTDFSDVAAAALPHVKDIVMRDGAEVYLLYVTENLEGFESYWGSGPDDRHRKSLRSFAETKSRERLRAICACELEGCPDYHLHFALGDPAEQILGFAVDHGVDLIVTARPPDQGEHSFGRAVAKVVERSPVPVLAVDVPPPAGPPSCA